MIKWGEPKAEKHLEREMSGDFLLCTGKYTENFIVGSVKYIAIPDAAAFYAVELRRGVNKGEPRSVLC